MERETAKGATWTVADIHRSIPDAFGEQVRCRPDKPALVGAWGQLTFAELDAAANRQAHELIARCGPGAGRTAFLLADGVPLIVAVLGALKAGKTAVVLNPSDPPARLAQVLRDARPELVLTSGEDDGRAGTAGFPVARVDAEAAQVPGSPEAPDTPIPPERTAFVIYTSGSTGEPRGVIQTHVSLLHKVLRLTHELGVSERDRLPLPYSMSGSSGVTLLLLVLLNGAAVYPIAAAERGLAGLARLLRDRQLTALLMAASIFRALVRTLDGATVSGVRMVCLGGEPVMARDVDSCRRHFGPDCLFANLLASTEAGSIAVHRVRVDDRLEPAPLAAGRPVAGIDVSLRDGRGAEVAFGEIGEIVVSSPYLSPGYWSDPALTAERFAEDSSGRSFRTGDLARFLPGGALALIGRRDLEVKVRGARIGLSEVETALAAAPGVAAAAVCPTPGVDGGPRLTAYVVGDAGTTLTPAGLRDALRQTLPDRALPSGFVFVDRLPLTVHGKVDRRRLERLPPPAPMDGEPAVSTTETEAVVAAIWADAFGLDQVAVGDDFFDLGGDSLTAIVIAAGIEQRLGANIDLRTVVESRTVAGMARTLEPRGSTADTARRTALDRAWPGDHLPVSYAQERMWLGSRTPEGSGRYTMAAGVRLRGQLDVPALRRALEHVVRRHDVLHTTFADRDGRLTQVVHAPEPLEVPLLDRSGVEDPETEVAAVLRDEVGRRVDLRRGPLIRFRLVRTAPEEHHLLWVHHHIVSDAWSWRVFFDELELLYPAFRAGDAPPLPDSLPSQYGDFAASERLGLDRSPQLHAPAAAWWRETLAALPPSPRLPFARATALPTAGLDDGVIWWGLPEEVSKRLDVMAREAAATPYMVRLATFAAHLARETGQYDLVLGGYATGRTAVETQAMFGLFANPLTLRLRLASDLTLRQLLARVGAYVVEASSWSQLPFDLLCADLRDHGLRPPDIRVMFDVVEGLPRELCGLDVTPVRSVPAAMPWEFSFTMDRGWEAGECRAQFDARIHDPDRVRGFIGRFQRLIAAVCSEPDRPIADVASPGR